MSDENPVVEVELIGGKDPFADHGPDGEQTDIGLIFHSRHAAEEHDEHEDCNDYDEDFEEEEEAVVSSYFNDFSVGNFMALSKLNRLDDLEELLAKSDKYKRAVEQYKNTHALFEDQEFRPGEQALMGYSVDEKERQRMGRYHFERSDVYFDADIKVYNNLSSQDILQGELGDCYFLAAISSIAEHPDRLKRIILCKENKGDGIYAVALCLNGVWEEVLLDDYAPCRSDNKLAFNSSKFNELWVVLLEKAWAKVHGGYLNIEAGLTREALRDLTGASAKTYFLKQKPESIWKRLMEAEKTNFIMTAGSDNLSGGSDVYIPKIGIAGSHAYSLLSVYQLKEDNGQYRLTGEGEEYSVRLLKLRNPWGKGEWKGDWCDEDARWTPELKGLLGFPEQVEDGIFFMTWEDFQTYYSDVQICYFHDGYKYSAIKSKSKRGEVVVLRFKLDTPGKYYFSVNQINRRFYPKQSGYRYSKISWVLGKQNEADAAYIASGNKVDKENWDYEVCEPGEYYALIYTNWRSITREFSYSVYGPGLTDFEQIPRSEIPENFTNNVFMSKARGDLEEKGVDFGRRNHPGIRYVSGENNGWAYMYFRNDEEDHQIKVTLKLGDSNLGVYVLPPHKGHKPTMVVGPGEENIIIYKSNGPKGVSVSMMTSFKQVPKREKVEEPEVVPKEPEPVPVPEEKKPDPPKEPEAPKQPEADKVPAKNPTITPRIDNNGVRVIRRDYTPSNNVTPTVKPYQPSGQRYVYPSNPRANNQPARIYKPSGRTYVYPSTPSQPVRSPTPGSRRYYYVNPSDRSPQPSSNRRYISPYQHSRSPHPPSPNQRYVYPSNPSTPQNGRSISPYRISDSSRPSNQTRRVIRQEPSSNHVIQNLSMRDQTRNSKLVLPKKMMGRDVDIKLYLHYHGQGMAMLWANRTHDLTLTENISFKLRNAIINGHGGSQLKFVLGPGEEKFVEIVKVGSAKHETAIENSTYTVTRGNSNMSLV